MLLYRNTREVPLITSQHQYARQHIIPIDASTLKELNRSEPSDRSDPSCLSDLSGRSDPSETLHLGPKRASPLPGYISIRVVI